MSCRNLSGTQSRITVLTLLAVVPAIPFSKIIQAFQMNGTVGRFKGHSKDHCLRADPTPFSFPVSKTLHNTRSCTNNDVAFGCLLPLSVQEMKLFCTQRNMFFVALC